MKKRDRGATPWLVRPTELFEAAFNRLISEHERDAALEVIDLFVRLAQHDPRMAGEQHSDLPQFWLFETPGLVRRLPRLLVVYGIDDSEGFVDLWNLYRL